MTGQYIKNAVNFHFIYVSLLQQRYASGKGAAGNGRNGGKEGEEWKVLGQVRVDWETGVWMLVAPVCAGS